MSTLKTYTVDNPLKPAKKPKKNKKSQMPTKEIEYRIKLIEKAFNKRKLF